MKLESKPKITDSLSHYDNWIYKKIVHRLSNMPACKTHLSQEYKGEWFYKDFLTRPYLILERIALTRVDYITQQFKNNTWPMSLTLAELKNKPSTPQCFDKWQISILDKVFSLPVNAVTGEGSFEALLDYFLENKNQCKINK